MNVNFKPDGYHTVTPFLLVQNASNLIDFMKQVFEAEEIERYSNEDGSIIHAVMQIGDSRVMLSDTSEQFPERTSMLHLYLPDVDTVYHRALSAGATTLREPEDEFFGDRSAGVLDQFGNQWWLATHVEDLSAEEMQRRMDAQK
ncbi:MAG: VOC family protein [Anaerolineales bacterium]|nr:VOC family protein [Anaerolineales bacterium]